MSVIHQLAVVLGHLRPYCAPVTAIAGLIAFQSSVSAQQGVELFSDTDQAPFLATMLRANETAEPAMVSAEDDIDARFAEMQKQLDALRATLADSQKAPAKPATPPVVFPTVKVSGFFHAEAGWFHQDAASLAMPQFGDIQDDRGFRRARLAATGKVAENISYMLEMDFAQAGRPSFMDVWMDVGNVPIFGNVRIGQYRMPFGMNELTSIKELEFLERPSMLGMAPFRQIGIGFHDISADENLTWAVSGYGTNTDQFGNSVGDRGYGTAERITAVLMEDSHSEFLIHGGLDHAYVATPNNSIQYRNVPEFGGPVAIPGAVPLFIDTGLIPAENANLFNAELATSWASVHAESELRCSLVNLSNGGIVTLPSFYAQAGWILTGEHRAYNKQNGVMGRIKPKSAIGTKCGGGVGAWELAVRYSWIDLNEGIVNGGELTNMTYGLNWYLNDYAKLQFNYISSDLNRAPVGDSQTDIFAVRCQLEF